MTRSMLGENSAYYPDGVVDICIIVVSLFYNPLYELAVEFISKILAREVNAAIPLTSIIGATHIVTRYLRIPFEEVERRVIKLLETESPAFYPHVSIASVMQSLDYALRYHIKPWDGYIVSLAKTIGMSTIYTFDKEFEKVEGLRIKNPFPEEAMRRYHEYITKLQRSRKTY